MALPARDVPDADGFSQPVGAAALDGTRACSLYCSECDCQSPRGHPAGPLRAACVQATPLAVSPLESTAAASPRALGHSRVRLRKRHSTRILFLRITAL